MGKTHKIVESTFSMAPLFKVECNEQEQRSVFGSLFWKDVNCKICLSKNTKGKKCDPIHVIEKSAYQKAVDALKEIYADGSYTDIAAEIATAALKELGELG